MSRVRSVFGLAIVLILVTIAIRLSLVSSAVPVTPTDVSYPTGTPIVASVPTADPPSRVFAIGQAWQDDGLLLELVKSDTFPNAVVVYFALTNLSFTDRTIDYGVNNFATVDHLGEPVMTGGVSWQPEPVFQYDCIPRTRVLKPEVQEVLYFSCRYGVYEGIMLKLDAAERAGTHVTITVSDIDRMERSQWRIPFDEPRAR